MIEILIPEYQKQLLENNQSLLNTIASQLRWLYFDDASRLVTRVGYIDDGYVRVRDTSASIDILDMLRAFSWTFYNLSEMSSNIAMLKNALESVGTDRLRVVGNLTFDPTTTLNVNIVNADMFSPVYAQLINADETQNQSITLDTGARSIVSVYAKADTPTTFHLDISNDNINWFTDVMTYPNTTIVNDTVITGFRYIKLRSDAAGVSGNKITLALTAKVG
jgi:hypothetical protein